MAQLITTPYKNYYKPKLLLCIYFYDKGSQIIPYSDFRYAMANSNNQQCYKRTNFDIEIKPSTQI